MSIFLCTAVSHSGRGRVRDGELSVSDVTSVQQTARRVEKQHTKRQLSFTCTNC